MQHIEPPAYWEHWGVEAFTNTHFIVRHQTHMEVLAMEGHSAQPIWYICAHFPSTSPMHDILRFRFVSFWCRTIGS